MAGPPDNSDLQRQLAKLQSLGEQPSPAEIMAIVESVMARLAGDLTAADLKLYAELEALARFIQNARSEIAAVRPHDIGSQDIPLATDELDAVVGATEEATGNILDAAEALSNLTSTLPPEAAEQVTAAVTRIYEACNFQDITGQRITKVVRTLKHIEERVSAMLSAFGEDTANKQAERSAEAPAAAPAAPAGKTDEKDLLHGPQLPDDAKKQAEIDAILASFDR
ncbi:MAG TPA: protein phosphatase CheZ [Candidatus Sulfotelmatobacter sp.]|nr:protein phosphatase CheZ [Candidatus Sulfotelmatobacter sp.]